MLCQYKLFASSTCLFLGGGLNAGWGEEGRGFNYLIAFNWEKNLN